ncbi:MAG TPA: GNAT family protein [Patescibacteria group bacterium]|nr:GNAT family protein [Patescibacteria group bacterium]
MELKTKRLILREWKDGDQKQLTEGINNLNITKWLLVVPYPYTKKDADWYINHCIEKYKKDEKEDYAFAIELKEEKKIIGGFSLDKVDKSQGKASVGYWIAEPYWNKGYASEAFDAVLKFAFDKLKLRRIEAGVFVGNPSSGKLLEKFGAKMEGTRRKSCVCKADGKIKDEFFYGLLKEEWRKMK